MSNAPGAAPQAPPKKKSKTKLIVIGLVAVAVGVGGAVYAMRRPATETTDTASSRGLVPFDPFVVNLADPGGTRFVRLTLSLVVNNEQVASNIVATQVSMKEARSAILELLAIQTAGTLATPEGKQALKKAIIERVSAIFTDAKVTDVYFSEFVVQF
jgi:flagellar FliL protein